MQHFSEFFAMKEVNFEGKFSDYFGEKSVLDENTLIVFDSETTGLDMRIPHVQILSISAGSFNIDNQSMTSTFNHFAKLNDQTLKKMKDDESYGDKKDAIGYNFINDFLRRSKWHEAEKNKTEKELVVDFANFLKQFKNVLLCGYNVGFDLRMINTCLKKNGHKPLNYPVIDVMKFVHVFLDPTLETLASKGIHSAAEMLGNITNKANKKSYSLQNVAAILNVLRADGHVSMADIEMTGKVLSQGIKFIKDNADNLGNEYSHFEKKSRMAYKKKLDFFHSTRNTSHDAFKSKQKILDAIQKDVFHGVQLYVKNLENMAEKERQKPDRKYQKLREIQLKINAINSLLKTFDGDKTKILKFVYNN